MILPVPPPKQVGGRRRGLRVRGAAVGAGVSVAALALGLRAAGASPGGDDERFMAVGFAWLCGMLIGAGGAVGYWIEGRFGGRGWRRAWEADTRPRERLITNAAEVRLMSRPASVIHADPDILGGVPVFVGTRVPVRTLLDYLAAGDSLAEFLDHFPTVSREQAVAALGQAAELLVTHARPA